MPDRRKHRGPHPQDRLLFGPEQLPALRAAGDDLAWLLGRGYAEAGALKLVGDRFGLTARQRKAVARCTCTDAERDGRQSRRVGLDALAGGSVAVDGFNLLITLESALGGGMILIGRDGAWRDLASMHGSYRTMAETVRAVELAGAYFHARRIEARWLLDRPVSNSGRLKTLMLDRAEAHGWAWTVELTARADADLIESARAVVTSDSVILDKADAWHNAAGAIISAEVPDAWIVDLGG